jgi:flavin reductase (DIM6/NTAB) family NADH-FMN oxidoreductase RutF
VVFSPTLKRDGGKKDTLRNVEATGEFVVNAAVAELARQVNLSAKELPPDESEVELAGLRLAPSAKVRPPRVADSPAHLECVVRQVVPVGSGPGSANLVIGEVVLIHVSDEVLDGRGRVDPRKLHAIARLGGDFYCHTTDLFEMKRP